MNTPIKRHESLQSFSREHHHGLLLCWKIRTGFQVNVDPIRIKSYTDWFWQHHLQPHFEAEEQYIFPILPPDHPLLLQAYQDHQELKKLFNQQEDIPDALQQIEQQLNTHIRFEERILFKNIQEVATPEQWEIAEKHHSEDMPEEWGDEFWLDQPK